MHIYFCVSIYECNESPHKCSKKIEHYVVVQQLMLMLRLGYCKI